MMASAEEKHQREKGQMRESFALQEAHVRRTAAIQLENDRLQQEQMSRFERERALAVNAIESSHKAQERDNEVQHQRRLGDIQLQNMRSLGRLQLQQASEYATARALAEEPWPNQRQIGYAETVDGEDAIEEDVIDEQDAIDEEDNIGEAW